MTSYEQLASGSAISKMYIGDEYMVKDMTYIKYFNDKPYSFTNDSEAEARARWVKLNNYRQEIDLYFLALENAAKGQPNLSEFDRFSKYINFQNNLENTKAKKVISSSDSMGLLFTSSLDTAAINERRVGTQQWFFREMFPEDKALMREVLDRRDQGDTRDIFRDNLTNALTNASYVGAAVVIGASAYGAYSVIAGASASSAVATAASENAAIAASATETGTIAGSSGLLTGTSASGGLSGVSLGAESLLSTASASGAASGAGLGSLLSTAGEVIGGAVLTAGAQYTTQQISSVLNPKKESDTFSYIPTPQLSVGDNLKTNLAIAVGGATAILLLLFI